MINRLQFEIQCPDEEQAFLLRHHVSSIVQDQLTEAIDKACSSQSKEDEIVQIDRLEIDLGTFTMHSFHTNFANVFADRLERHLKEIVSLPEKKNASYYSISEAELLFHFLLNGDLPWWANENGLDLNSIAQDLVSRQPVSFSSFLYQEKRNSTVWKRVTWQLNTETKTVLFLLIKELSAAQEQFEEWSKLVISTNTGNVDAAALSQKQSSQDILLLNAPFFLAHQEPKTLLAQLYTSYLQEILVNDASLKEVIISSFKKIVPPVTSEAHNTLPNGEKSLVMKENTSSTEPLVEKEKYLLKNAGIVLLSPFFKPLFERLQLFDQKQWLEEDAQYKAVHLLSFLATGTTGRPEYGLVLEKMLCGMSPSEPIPPAKPFTQHEIEETESVLLSAIEHWKALKNTSVNGFRETFLKRDGILSPSPNGWRVQVERKTVDVLLDSIPWGYTTITSSWNPNFIFVEW